MLSSSPWGIVDHCCLSFNPDRCELEKCFMSLSLCIIMVSLVPAKYKLYDSFGLDKAQRKPLVLRAIKSYVCERDRLLITQWHRLALWSHVQFALFAVQIKNMFIRLSKSSILHCSRKGDNFTQRKNGGRGCLREHWDAEGERRMCHILKWWSVFMTSYIKSSNELSHVTAKTSWLYTREQ